jgi:hypothetical protein
MAQALKADSLQATINYYQLALQVAGPDNVDEFVKRDVVLDRARQFMLVPADVVPDEKERKQAQEANAQRQALAVAAEGAVKAAPNIVDAMAQPEAQAA